MIVERMQQGLGGLVWRSVLLCAALGIALVVVTIPLQRPGDLLALVSGILGSMFSFIILVWAVAHSVSASRAGRKSSQGWIVLLSSIKLALVAVTMWWLITEKRIDPLFFLAGFSVMIVVLIVEGCFLGRRALRP